MKKLLLLLFLLLSIPAHAQVLTGNKIINKVLTERGEYYQSRFEDQDLRDHPLGFHSEAIYKDEYGFNQLLIEQLDSVVTDSLSFDDLISYKLLRYSITNRIKYYEFKEYLNPLLSESGFHTNILGIPNRSWGSKESLERYLVYLRDIPRYFDEYLLLMRRGIEMEITQPVEGLQNYEATYDPYIVDDPQESYFWKPFGRKPDDISDDEWVVLLATAEVVIDESVTASYARLKAFFEEEYFPNARPGLGASTIPKGKEYYEYKVHYYTTQDMTPDEVHEIGLKEVARINKEMELIKDEVGFDGSMADFFNFLRTDPQFFPKTGEELLKDASFIAKKVDGRLPSLFGLLPRQPYGVEPVPDYLAPNYTGGRYSGAPLDSDRGGEYWVNTYNLPSRTLYTLPALTLHEAMPGHHLQIALTAELESLPTFRRSMYIDAFGEGWGLYAEYLGEELGIYETPYEMFGRYTYEMWRACRLVIDTGIHYKGWTRDQAVQYLAENSALSLHEVNTEINRYITWPGQALAYKIGELTIKRLRNKTEDALGDHFDIKEFHDLILSKGTVTMSILEEITDHYIQNKLESQESE